MAPGTIAAHLRATLRAKRELNALYEPNETTLLAGVGGDMFVANDPYTGGGTHLPRLQSLGDRHSNGIR